jgi:hypothetical protein
MTRFKLNTAAYVVLAVFCFVIVTTVLYQGFNWTVNRVYVPEGKSLLLRYKGPLFLTWHNKYAEGKFAQDGEIGVLENMPGPGRHFYCPIW